MIRPAAEGIDGLDEGRVSVTTGGGDRRPRVAVGQPGRHFYNNLLLIPFPAVTHLYMEVIVILMPDGEDKGVPCDPVPSKSRSQPTESPRCAIGEGRGGQPPRLQTITVQPAPQYTAEPQMSLRQSPQDCIVREGEHSCPDKMRKHD